MLTTPKRLAAGIIGALTLMTVLVSPAGATAVSTSSPVEAAVSYNYRAEASCYKNGRRFSASMITNNKPTSTNQFYTEALGWGYNIQKTTGNHNNSTVIARVMIFRNGAAGPGWYHLTGIDWSENMPEDAKWHAGDMNGSRPGVGWNPQGDQVAIHVQVMFDGNENTGCAVLLNVGKLILV
jgi:hypothetical protein